VILLDTHAWIWWASGDGRLSAPAAQRIDDEPRLGISPISCWEVATLVRKGPLKLRHEVETWIDHALHLRGIELVPLSWWGATLAGTERLDFDKDPADRLIAATALEHELPIVTCDANMHAFESIETIW
jgi:PIN domain nuclease of toxin-antitoxin system